MPAVRLPVPKFDARAPSAPKPNESTVWEIRLRNLMLLRMQFQEDTLRRFPDTPIHGMDKAFSELLGLNPKYFGHIKNGRRNVGNKLSRHIESQFRLPIGFMDAAHSESAGATDPERQFTLSALELYRVDPAGALAVVMRALGDALARKQSPGKAP